MTVFSPAVVKEHSVLQTDSERCSKHRQSGSNKQTVVENRTPNFIPKLSCDSTRLNITCILLEGRETGRMFPIGGHSEGEGQ